MLTLTFYEKPGCITNAKQRKLLTSMGLSLQVKNLLTQPWTEHRLKAFFLGTPVTEWINPNAPRVKSGEVNAGILDQQQALRLMIADPLLIRRPLLECNAGKWAGFDIGFISQQLGLQEPQTFNDNPEACSNNHEHNHECQP